MVYKQQKAFIIEKLQNEYQDYLKSGNEEKLHIIAVALYNFGYLPDRIKCRRIYKEIIDDMVYDIYLFL